VNVDVEALLSPWLESALTARGVTDLPSNLADMLPVVQVTRIGGADDDNVPSFDVATVDLDFFAADRVAASDLARRGHYAMRVTLPGRTVAGATVTMVQTITGPSWRPYDDTALRRFGSTYRLHVKS